MAKTRIELRSRCQEMAEQSIRELKARRTPFNELAVLAWRQNLMTCVLMDYIDVLETRIAILIERKHDNAQGRV